MNKTFCAAHAVRLPDGSLEPVHGHNWRVRVTVGVQELNGMDMVIDFHELEGLLDSVVSTAKNTFLNQIGPFATGPVSPTAERVAWWVGQEIATGLPEGVRLVAVAVREAPGCEATFRPSMIR